MDKLTGQILINLIWKWERSRIFAKKSLIDFIIWVNMKNRGLSLRNNLVPIKLSWCIQSMRMNWHLDWNHNCWSVIKLSPSNRKTAVLWCVKKIKICSRLQLSDIIQNMTKSVTQFNNFLMRNLSISSKIQNNIKWEVPKELLSIGKVC